MVVRFLDDRSFRTIPNKWLGLDKELPQAMRVLKCRWPPQRTSERRLKAVIESNADPQGDWNETQAKVMWGPGKFLVVWHSFSYVH